MLQGNELIDSQLELKFRTDLPKRDICSMTLDDEAVGGRGGWVLRTRRGGRCRVLQQGG